jgi:hydrogenase nickel incorporation protein HypA/HybF
MHEISLCESLREILEEQAVEQGFERVTRVWLEIGPLSCVEPEALRFGFDAVMTGSVAEGAALEIAHPPGHARCLGCGAEMTVTDRLATCPDCGATELRVTGGDALKIRKLEVV